MVDGEGTMSAQAREETRRGVGAGALFAVVYTTSAAAIYFALGLVAKQALGLTPLVFLVGGGFLALAGLSYLQGSIGESEPGGSSQIAGRAFNQLVSFIAGWAVVLDFLVVIAISATTAAGYLATIWSPLGRSPGEFVCALLVIGAAAQAAIRGTGRLRLTARLLVAVADIGAQVVIVGLGVFLILDPQAVVASVDLPSSPAVVDVISALTLVTVGFTGIEAASSLAPEVSLPGRSIGRLFALGVAVVVALQVGIAFIALSAFLPAKGYTELGGQWLKAPLVGVARQLDPTGVGPALGDVVAVTGALALLAAAGSGMLAVSRLAYALARNRQVPRVVGRLSTRYGTPWLIIVISSLAAFCLSIPGNITMLAAVYAFGAMLAVTLVHVSVIRLGLRPGAKPAWTMPLTLGIRGRLLPLPAVAGAVASAGALAAVLVLHPTARIVGLAWLATGVLLYVIYRRLTGNSILRQVKVSPRALQYEPESARYGAILVPVLGTSLDDDIVQTAGRLAGGDDPTSEDGGAHIEAVWFHEIPLALPIDAALSEAQKLRAGNALRRAKAVGEEYQGVTVSTAQVRVRRTGEGIVNEARRRGAQAIVLAAEELVRAGGGSALGGLGSAGASSVGEMTKYVLRKAQCRVILTVPAWEASRSGNDQAE